MREEDRGRPSGLARPSGSLRPPSGGPPAPRAPASLRAERIAQALLRWPEVWLVLVPALYTLAVLAPPLLAHTGYDGAGETLFGLFRGLCHQLPHRTIHLAGEPMAVCARCFALAAGLAASGLLVGRAWGVGLRVRLPAWAMLAGAAPMALDGFSQLFGFRESTNTLRVATGVILGAAVSLWAVPVVLRAFEEMQGKSET